MFLEVEEGGQDQDEEAVKVYLIRFIADLPLSWFTGSVIEYLLNLQSVKLPSDIRRFPDHFMFQ